MPFVKVKKLTTQENKSIRSLSLRCLKNTITVDFHIELYSIFRDKIPLIRVSYKTIDFHEDKRVNLEIT